MFKKDPATFRLLRAEINRQAETLDLIPSENFASPAVLELLGSPLTNKYAEGYPGARYYGGNEIVDDIENLCRERALKLFRLPAAKWGVNVQPYSGSTANLAVYLALVPPGEKIMGMQLNMGGHLTHGHKVSASGKIWVQVPYGVDPKTEQLDYKAIERIALKEKPKLIVAGYTAYPRRIDFNKLQRIARAAHAILMVDMSHIAGLVAGGAHASPFPYADVVTTTTHKTLRGPRAAMIFARQKFMADINRAVFPGLQGGPHMNQIAATVQALYEAGRPEFRTYAAQVVKNAKALASELKNLGWRLVSGGTDNHLLLLHTAAKDISGQAASNVLEAQGIIVNKNTIPFDARPPADPSGIRLGTPALTTRGMREKDMRHIAGLIHAILAENKNVKKEVRALCAKFPTPYGD